MHELTRGRRSENEIALDILKIVASGQRKTRIMYGANLSYVMLNRHLGLLVENGFVRREADVYRITDAGRALMADLERVRRHFDASGARTIREALP